jgi:uncharacterized protein
MPGYATLAKVLPFAVFIALMIFESLLKTWAPGLFTELQYFLYPLRILITVAVLIWMWKFSEQYRPPWHGMTMRASFLAAAIGLAIIVFWIVIGPMFRIGTPSQANPIPQDALLGPLWLGMRFLGAVLVVPIIEELFWRSYLARKVDAMDVDRLSPRDMSIRAILASSVAFGLAHAEVLAGAVSGIAFCWLYKRRGDLREAILAHAIANALLFVYVVKFSAFEFWG